MESWVSAVTAAAVVVAVVIEWIYDPIVRRTSRAYCRLCLPSSPRRASEASFVALFLEC